MPDTLKTIDPVASPKTTREQRNPSGFNEPDYPDNAADQVVPETSVPQEGDDASAFDDRHPSDSRSDVNSGSGSPSDIHKY